mmetsp:Transcript_6789/g.19248  ORF Transcript_6789/g.19248 Transcript_6789/m.19248 type:complete len:212 (+) Transcript_6789:213-848(+)
MGVWGRRWWWRRLPRRGELVVERRRPGQPVASGGPEGVLLHYDAAEASPSGANERRRSRLALASFCGLCPRSSGGTRRAPTHAASRGARVLGQLARRFVHRRLERQAADGTRSADRWFAAALRRSTRQRRRQIWQCHVRRQRSLHLHLPREVGRPSGARCADAAHELGWWERGGVPGVLGLQRCQSSAAERRMGGVPIAPPGQNRALLVPP